MSDEIVQTFRLGQKVVRIKTGDGPAHPSASVDIGGHTIIGGIYTIRWIGESEFIMSDGTTRTKQALRFHECARVLRSSNGMIVDDYPFSSAAYRPLVEDTKKEEQTTSIDIFQRIAQAVTDGKPLIPDKLPKREYIE